MRATWVLSLAAVVDLAQGDQVACVPLGDGSHAFGAAILPDGKTGLVTDEATGQMSVIDLATARLVTDIAVSPSLSHPPGRAVDSAGQRAYVALSASDLVVVVDRATRKVERTISVGRAAGLGTQPVALALDATGTGCSPSSPAPTRSRSSACRRPEPPPPRPTSGGSSADSRPPRRRRPCRSSPRPAGGRRKSPGRRPAAWTPASGRAEEVAWTSARGVDAGQRAGG